MADDSGVGRGLFVGFLLGSAVGSVIALLYAPKTGKELRGDIKERSDDFLKDTENYIEQARSRAKRGAAIMLRESRFIGGDQNSVMLSEYTGVSAFGSKAVGC